MELPRAEKYPSRIRLPEATEALLAGLTDDLLAGRIELHELPRPIADLFALGHIFGQASMQPALDHANYTADRLYMEVCRRVPRRHIGTDEQARFERADRRLAHLLGVAA